MAPTTLHLLQSRRATFNKSRKGANRALNWPHALTNTASKPSTSTIHPDHLAAAGFYCTPTAEEPTRSTCYLCSTVVEAWQEGDDPLTTHLELNETCGWAVLQRLQGEWTEYEGTRPQKEWTAAFGEEGQLHPRSERINSAREASFGVGWPHHEDKGVPTAAEIAQAGWFFGGGGEDNCVCPFCTRTVEGWEEGDDPIALHKRKLGLKCPFFLAGPPPAVSLAPPSISKGRKAAAAPAVDDAPAPPAKLSRSKAQSRLAQQVDDEEEEEPAQSQSQPARASRRTKTTAPSSDGPETSVVGESLRPSSRSTRAKKPASTVSASAPPSVVEEGEDEAEEPSQSQSNRGGRRVQQVEVVIDIPAKSKKGSTAKGKTTKGKKVAPVEEEPVAEEEAAEEEVVEQQQEEETDAMEDDEPTPAPAPAPKKASARSKLAQAKTTRPRSTKTKEKEIIVAEDADIVEEGERAEEMAEAARLAHQFLDMDAEPQQPVKKTKAKAKSSSTSKKVSPVAVVEPAPAPVVVEARGPLTPTVASPSPRPIRSLPSKVNSPSTSAGLKAPPLPAPTSLTSTYTAPSAPFSSSPLPPLTTAELSMTLSEYYDAQGRATYEAMQSAMKGEYELLERRIEQGRKQLETMLEAAKAREKRERASPRKMRA